MRVTLFIYRHMTKVASVTPLEGVTAPPVDDKVNVFLQSLQSSLDFPFLLELAGALFPSFP